MLDFRKGYFGLLVALRLTGTAWPYGIIPGLISATIGLVLGSVNTVDELISEDDIFLENHYPFQLFAYIVGVVMVFRTNFTYRRYWYALEAVQVMGARWLAGACLATAADSPGTVDASLPFLSLSAATLSEADAKCIAGSSHRAFFTEVVHLFSLLHALALQHLRMEPDLVRLEDSSWENGEWIRLVSGGASPFTPTDSVVNCRTIAPQDGRLKVLGQLSTDELRVLSLDSSGKEIPGDVRVSMVLSWIMRRLIARQKHEPHGDMSKTSPPILSRLFALVSDGALAFSQAKKIAEVPFPFPYHNLKEAFLWIYAATVPVVVNAKADHLAFRFVVNFMAVWAYFALSKVGDNLEDPFVEAQQNDLPLSAIHHGFNVQLLSYGMVPFTAAPAVIVDEALSARDDQPMVEAADTADPGNLTLRPQADVSLGQWKVSSDVLNKTPLPLPKQPTPTGARERSLETATAV